MAICMGLFGTMLMLQDKKSTECLCKIILEVHITCLRISLQSCRLKNREQPCEAKESGFSFCFKLYRLHTSLKRNKVFLVISAFSLMTCLRHATEQKDVWNESQIQNVERFHHTGHHNFLFITSNWVSFPQKRREQ